VLIREEILLGPRSRVSSEEELFRGFFSTLRSFSVSTLSTWRARVFFHVVHPLRSRRGAGRCVGRHHLETRRFPARVDEESGTPADRGEVVGSRNGFESVGQAETSGIVDVRGLDQLAQHGKFQLGLDRVAEGLEGDFGDVQVTIFNDQQGDVENDDDDVDDEKLPHDSMDVFLVVMLGRVG